MKLSIHHTAGKRSTRRTQLVFLNVIFKYLINNGSDNRSCYTHTLLYVCMKFSHVYLCVSKGRMWDTEC